VRVTMRGPDGEVVGRAERELSAGDDLGGVRFGPPDLELWVDGVLATRAELLVTDGAWVASECGLPTTAGLAGNANPWVLGASTHDSDEDLATPVDGHLVGAIDDLRISASRD